MGKKKKKNYLFIYLGKKSNKLSEYLVAFWKMNSCRKASEITGSAGSCYFSELGKGITAVLSDLRLMLNKLSAQFKHG